MYCHKARLIALGGLSGLGLADRKGLNVFLLHRAHPPLASIARAFICRNVLGWALGLRFSFCHWEE